ncbi:MAG TPA: DinB family protein [Candidatus Sulfopaludibacter sp.]|nr:DinB family protein [Candidatus Sulfopaludibacter sp.]
MTAENAKVIADYTLTDYEQERAPTKRVIAALPCGQEGYAPGEKCMKSLDLAWHLASSELFFLNGICSGQFGGGESSRPANIQTAQDVLTWYDENLPPAIERARALPAEHFAQTIDFFGMMQLSGVAYLSLMVKHSVHHRGQLSSYLRPMGAKVPGIYGPSGDMS